MTLSGSKAAPMVRRFVSVRIVVWTPVAIGLWVAGTIAEAQAPSQRSFAAPEAVSTTAFSRVGAIRELGDKRVIVVDAEAPSIVLLSTDLRVSKPVGRIGRGPGEYQLPSVVYPLPNDSSGVLDQGSAKLLVIDPHGKALGAREARWHRACSGTGNSRLQSIAAIDALGRSYAEADPIRVSNGTQVLADSAAIERWTPPCYRDTLASIPNRNGKGARLVGGLVMGGEASTTRPFSARVHWVVAPDGWIAIVRPDPYSVDFVSPDGRLHPGRPIAFERVRVDERMKEEWRDMMREPRKVRTVDQSGGSSLTVIAVPFDEPATWPSYLPPYLESPLAAPDGSVWVLRADATREAPTYDVINRSATIAERVVLQPRSRVVGFGQSSVYIVRRDNDDLEHLERYARVDR